MLLRELIEQKQKTAVISFGRLNPPTVGHAKLIDKITSIPGDHFLFLSHKQNPKTDPLNFAAKLKFAEQFFTNITIGDRDAKTPVQALNKLQQLGYTDIIFVAGSDRIDSFEHLFKTYNGQPDRNGTILFKFNSIKVISAGQRDPDANDITGMSASKLRQFAAVGNFEAFAQGVPDKKLAQSMFNAVQAGMGVKQTMAENVNIDNKEGWGSVPYNQDIDYRGKRVKMKPSVFLKLAADRNGVPAVDAVISHIKNGGAIGAPFLIIEYINGEEPRVKGHEGRSRMIAIQQLYGDIPVEVHLMFRGDVSRARHLTPEIIDALQTSMVSQNDQTISGPLFAESIIKENEYQ